MRAISPNRQTGVATHVFSRSRELAVSRCPRKSTRGSASPLEFGQDLVNVFCRRTYLRLGLATRKAGIPEAPRRSTPSLNFGRDVARRSPRSLLSFGRSTRRRPPRRYRRTSGLPTARGPGPRRTPASSSSTSRRSRLRRCRGRCASSRHLAGRDRPRWRIRSSEPRRCTSRRSSA